MADTKDSKPATRVVQWTGFKPEDTATTGSYEIRPLDWKVLHGPDSQSKGVLFTKENGFFAEVPADDAAVLEYFEKTPGFKVKPVSV